MPHDDRLPWQKLMEIAFGMLGIPPDAFWNMTPPEWLCALNGWRKKYGIREITVPEVSRDELQELMNLFPD